MDKIQNVLNSKFEIDKDFDDEKFMRVRFNAMTTEDNWYGLIFTKESLYDSEESWKNAAILANVIEKVDENGDLELDYGGHDSHIEEDAFWDGKDIEEQNRVIYDERVVGVIPESNNFEIVERGDYVDIYVTGYIYRDYGNYVADILEKRNGEVEVSSELTLDDTVQKRDPATKQTVITVNKFRATGITLLGKHKKPAMPNAKATVFSRKEVNEIIQELKNTLDNYTVQTGESEKKGGKYELAIKKIEDDDARVVVPEETTETPATNPDTSEPANTNTEPDNTNANTNENENVNNSDGENANTDPDTSNETDPSESQSDASGESDAGSTDAVGFSIVKGKHKFDVSLSDIERKISEKVDETYSDENTWLWSEVYVDPKYVIMHESKYDPEDDTCKNETYKQNYDVTDSVVTLLGERVKVHYVWLTDDEQAALDKIKSDYEAALNTISQYEAEPEKMELLMSNDYAFCSETDEFKSLLDPKNHFDLSMEELTAKANNILLASVKSVKFEAPNVKSNSKVGMKVIAPHVSVCKNYGSLLDEI